MADREDILDNKFFQYLQQTHASLYAQVQKNLWVVLVPQMASLPGVRITAELIQLHVLKPSPLFKAVYEVSSNPEKTVEFGEDNTIDTQSGFPQERTVNILFEETFYNKDYLPFRVLCIDRPLVGGSLKPPEPLASPIAMPHPRLFAESMDYLRAFPENELVLKKMDKLIDEFQSTYVLIKKYEKDAHEKVAKLVETASEQLLCANIFFRKMQNNPRQLRDVSMIIESYVMLGLFNKLCNGLRVLMDAEDTLVTEIASCHRMNGTLLFDFGSHLDLKTIDFSKPISSLDELEYCKTPLQMLFTLQACIDGVSTILSNYFSQHRGTEPITTDDLIPIVAFLVTRSKFRYFQSTLVYIENFTFEDVSSSELGYNFTNFKAAISYLSDPSQRPMKILEQNNVKIRDTRRASSTSILGPSRPNQKQSDSPARPPAAEPPSPAQLAKQSQNLLDSQHQLDAILVGQQSSPSLLSIASRSPKVTNPTQSRPPRAAISFDDRD